MLALRLVLSSATSPDVGRERTLVFDEVDAGIGGAAAQAIGEALAELGRSHQVLVVTHLAPVSYTHLTLPTRCHRCRSRWSP